MAANPTIAAPIRCFLGNVPKEIEKASDESSVSFRLMGTIVKISTHETRQYKIYTSKMVIDDGTGSCCIFVTRSMLDTLNVHVGEVLECVVDKNMQAKQLVKVQDPHAETLRWLELSYFRKQKGVPNDHMGYPCPKEDKKDRVFQIISSESPENNSQSSGISFDDLALILGLQAPDMQDLLDDLQESGMIYKNAKGLYVPL